MTINEFCVVLENTGKTVKCRMLGHTTVQGDAYAPHGSQVKPDSQHEYGPVFRLYIRGPATDTLNPDNYTYSFIGSYPYCSNSPEARRKGYFHKTEPTRAYYENHND